MIDIPKNKKIILFDGICNLCNDVVLKLIKIDKKNTFMFASLQSKSGQELINYLNIDVSKVDSIILFEPGVSYDIKSTAVLKVLHNFGGLWLLSQTLFVFPEGLRNLIYDFIAKNRYQWFGKRESCMLPTPEIKAKFLE
ncbi:Predicted thiol-disulfide oxidoreductase YuxK, DCC family [Polaribacter sp. Hel1_33_78]|jgi:predicted DCC family thiol-disulfide oxidoreductase YuxK|uniref:thiol-disulfide oxidoreductase DCC family protein n=1 Tax=unclassified Polaribacter TaxID=196858 RepID=UPI00052C0270|nr:MULTISPECIES: thiol-disulfide oxidoreductase DCC family protein [unclassified Polaribacter]KGL60918.1 hypothetical protein PHEL49_1812 [Polaribacter sp. Hel1_33_49]MBT3741644.1 thiol-disulfide oxidoreductase DCC family protein [Polaribacter sp.]MBT4414011.1 thiol-disulfide oxidoreductase DCC family protein [Polaribacter sp.]MBT7816015.1 thiol-disulfide oxidoreductase DCC family protein [Polaribacter sp.]MDG1195765.1 thiol-disulfide oxidoreductase DCC family protein [Polaribacter sp.]